MARISSFAPAGPPGAHVRSSTLAKWILGEEGPVPVSPATPLGRRRTGTTGFQRHAFRANGLLPRDIALGSVFAARVRGARPTPRIAASGRLARKPRLGPTRRW